MIGCNSGQRYVFAPHPRHENVAMVSAFGGDKPTVPPAAPGYQATNFAQQPQQPYAPQYAQPPPQQYTPRNANGLYR